MKKRIMKVLLLVCGLNVFTACYGMPPGDWEPRPLPENQKEIGGENAKSADEPDAEDAAEEEFVTE